MCKLLLALTASLLVVETAAACDLPRARPIWVSRDPDTTLVLMGSVHRLAPGEFAVPTIADRLDRRSRVYFESRPLSMFGNLRAALRARSSVPLETLLPTDDWARVEALGVRLGVGRTILQRLDPFMLAGYFQERSLQSGDNRTAGNGVDAQMRRHAGARRADIRYLEDKQALLAEIDSLPMDAKLAFLMTAVGELERGETSTSTEIWRTGDLCKLETTAEAMAEEASGDPQAAPIHRLLVDERNRRFAEAAAEAMEVPGSHVMVVGALHLVGPDSVISQLRARGFEVELAPSDD